MTVRRFVGATARDCLRRAKEVLGADAVVISNRAVEGGIEIVAMSPESLDAISQQLKPVEVAKQPPPPSITGPATDFDGDYTVALSAARREAARHRDQALIRPWEPERLQVPGAAGPAAQAGNPPPVATGTPRPAAAERIAPPPVVDRLTPPPHGHGAHHGTVQESSLQTAQLIDEVRVIKELLERQLAGFAWGEMAREAPARAQLLAEMLSAGFSSALARRLVQEMAADLNHEEGRRYLTAAINRRLRTLSSEADFIDRGGVYALVGPTGVGKTTTTAKLAARCVVRYGADSLALLTTDSYRIGAHEQLRIYGRILGVPVFVVRDGDDLRRTLADLRGKHMVLIDTVGMSQRDRMVAEQAAMLTRSGEVNRLLLLNAGSRGDTLDDVVRSYGGEDLAGCILTKVDEATALAPALDCIVRHGLTLSYVGNGQRVPEDLHLPNRKYLLHRAFKVGAGETAHSLRKEEVGLTMAHHGTKHGESLA
ncbi:MAG: flagellar biosynthesis protein FlhF [Rhodocyclales bacterium]|nr:flagellar biosynthesis protein FlhF [Rhodocyclales bacterium]